MTKGRQLSALEAKTANAAALISFTLPGMRFHFLGEFEGRVYKSVVQIPATVARLASIELSRSYQMNTDWDQTTIDLYYKLNAIIGDDVWHDGEWTYKTIEGTSDCWRLMGWTWELNGKAALVVVNYSEKYGSGRVKLNVPAGTVNFVEMLTNVTYPRDGDEVKNSGLFVGIEPWSA